MKNFHVIAIFISGVILSACATSGEQKTSSKTFTPLLVKNSGNYSSGSSHIVKSGDYIIKEPIEPQDMVKVKKSVTFKGRNPLIGVLGPEIKYKVDAGDKFFMVATSRNVRTFCQLKGEKFFKICFIDEDSDGDFDKRALSVLQKEYGPGDLFNEDVLSEPLLYQSSDRETGLYYAITYKRGSTRPKFSQYMIDSDDNIIAELPGVTKPPKGQKPPYNIAFKGSEIQVTRWDNLTLEYKIVKSVPPSLILTRF